MSRVVRRTRVLIGTAALGALLLPALLAAPAALAQPARLNVGGTDSIEVVSEGGFEFHDGERVAVARGGAVATQGELSVKADTLAAYFRKRPDGSNEIYRLTAEGGVRIGTASQTAQGDRAVYDADQRVAVLTGEDLRLTTEQDVITAEQSLEFWRDQNLAVARGDALATRGENKVRADRLVGLLEEDGSGNLQITRIDAEGGVVITTPTEVARGERGTYDMQSRLASLTGNVRITRGQNQLSGAAAEVDLEAGTSRILAGAADKVRGLFIPDPGNGQPPLADAPATPAPVDVSVPGAAPAAQPESPAPTPR
ncbi:LptA/OstA family protein [Indioceanicola profundi]|uniref:LptA/OstA family protein n=1 Tax=Indioceanicola profundi TaxID=2220096 RepID=UPI000E6AB475|nr:LptA/OstA family protein [Indioceanicola profundi]